MCDHERQAALAKAEVVYEMPARIIKGRCSSCGEDLNDLANKIAADIEPQTYRCTGCGIELVTEEMEVRVWRCKKCKRPLIKYGQDKCCNGCGRELMYTGGSAQNQEEQK